MQSYKGLIPQGDPGAILYDKLETVIELLGVMVGLAPTDSLVQQYPDLGELFARGGTPGALARRHNKALEIMLAASLPSAPENVQTYVVGTAEERLASNMSQPLMRIDVTNLNVAQPLLVSKKGVVPSAGGIILARETKTFVLPNGSELWGIVALGTIIVTVGYGYDIQPVIAALVEQEGL